MSRQLLPAVSFENKTRNRGLDCEFLRFGAFGVSVAGQFAYKQIVTMS